MKIGLMIAVEQELEAFLRSGGERTKETVAGRTVYRTRMEGHDIFAVCSGCGEMSYGGGVCFEEKSMDAGKADYSGMR